MIASFFLFLRGTRSWAGLDKNLSVRTVVIPAGDKPSVVADAPEDYAKDTSPDKGAVACYLEDPSSQSPLQLLLVNCHLYGTNKYGVKEAVFDKVSEGRGQAVHVTKMVLAKGTSFYCVNSCASCARFTAEPANSRPCPFLPDSHRFVLLR